MSRAVPTSDARVPVAPNLALFACAGSASLALLWAASRASSVAGLALCAVAFSFTNNTVFSLLHEAVHGKFLPNRRTNEWFGRVLAAFFPTGLSFQRACHLGHHRRNRTAVELFDYYAEGDNRPLKFVQWYGILTGLYWMIPPFGCLAFLVIPKRVLERALDARGSSVVEHMGAEAMLDGFAGVSSTRVRLEVLVSIALQALACYALGLTPAGWLACYAAFGLNWSSIQYADHAWSELSVRDGAWNLRAPRLFRWAFLNYHHHLAHHQHPEVPWIHLGRYVDEAAPRPSFARVYLSMWRGPRPLPPRSVVPRPGERVA